LCRRFDAALQAKDGETPIHDGLQPTFRPELWAGPNATDIVFAYETWNGMDGDVNLRRFAQTSGPHAFGTPKTNSQGCMPQIGWSGTPSATSPSAFTISASNVLNQKAGLLFYGYATRFAPFQGATMYVFGPRRTAIQFSNGPVSGSSCTGTFAYDFNARIQGGVDPELVPGRTITAQYYYRDPMDPAGFSTGLTDALRFTICP
jgi:hypothetical protein